eukprot:6301042-Pyramimonas_sp.AAC.1
MPNADSMEQILDTSSATLGAIKAMKGIATQTNKQAIRKVVAQTVDEMKTKGVGMSKSLHPALLKRFEATLKLKWAILLRGGRQ